MKFFNTAGPIIPADHYYIPHRLNEAEVRLLIEQKKYFILHAPRQSGKTTAISEFAHQLNQEGNYKALYINIEPAQAARANIIMGLTGIFTIFKMSISNTFGLQDPAISYLENTLASSSINISSLLEFLNFWSQASSKPVILFIDEIDSLIGDTLLSVLRQLRAGYINRPKNFPQSIALVGVRDVRDYRIWSDKDQQYILGGSAFNIKAESLKIPNFTPQQVQNLYNQHTQATGQQFTQEAIDYAFYLTQGQPWLVNALAYQACFRDVKDRNIIITKETIERVKEELISRRDTHLDVLMDRLQESRVYKILDAVFAGSTIEELYPEDDLLYVRDLGLITQKGIEIANPIYKEVLPRALSYARQEGLPYKTVAYLKINGELNMHKLLSDFQQFYRENGAIWAEQFNYKESGPHLILMAFLQRIINGGGNIHREYALGRGRMDLYIRWRQQRIVIEIKIMYSDKTVLEGLEQTAHYMDSCNATEGHLVIFDRAKTKTWQQKIFTKTENIANHSIMVWGM